MAKNIILNEYIKTCRCCNKDFKTKNHMIKYCSDICRNKHKYDNYKINYKNIRKRKSIILAEKECVECKKHFFSFRNNQKFCSKLCNNLNNRRKPTNNQLPLLKLRFEILERDGFKCQYCGRNPREHNCILNIDHIIPRIKGGLTTYENLITSCKECNLGKGDTLLNKHKEISKNKQLFF
jgi:hypothetical protein